MKSIAKTIININTLAARIYHRVLVSAKAGKSALGYLRHRKVSNQVINDYELGYAPKDDVLLAAMRKHGFTDKQLLASGLFTTGKGNQLYDYFFKRIMYPIRNHNGQIVAFSGRVLNKADSDAKYLNTQETPVFHKGKTIFNLDKAVKSIKAHNDVILVEGYMDVLSAYQAGVKNVIASMGTSLTDDQIKVIKGYTKHVTVCYDGDEPGQHAIDRAMKLLSGKGVVRTVVQMPKGIDPDEYRRQYGCKAFRNYMAKNVEAPALFELRFMKDGLDMTNVTSQVCYLHKAIRVLSNMKAGHLMNVCIDDLAKAFHVQPGSFRQDIASRHAAYDRKHSWGKPSNDPLELTEQKLMHAVMAKPYWTKTIIPQNVGMTPAYIEMFNAVKFYYRKHGKVSVKGISYIMNGSHLSSAYHAVTKVSANISKASVNVYLANIKRLNGVEYWSERFGRSFKNAVRQGNVADALFFKKQIVNAQRQLARA